MSLDYFRGSVYASGKGPALEPVGPAEDSCGGHKCFTWSSDLTVQPTDSLIPPELCLHFPDLDGAPAAYTPRVLSVGKERSPRAAPAHGFSVSEQAGFTQPPSRQPSQPLLFPPPQN